MTVQQASIPPPKGDGQNHFATTVLYMPLVLLAAKSARVMLAILARTAQIVPHVLWTLIRTLMGHILARTAGARRARLQAARHPLPAHATRASLGLMAAFLVQSALPAHLRLRLVPQHVPPALQILFHRPVASPQQTAYAI